MDSKNYSEEVVKSYICLHGSIVQERRRNHQLSIVNLGAIYAGGSSNNNRANNLLFGRELAQLIFSGKNVNVQCVYHLLKYHKLCIIYVHMLSKTPRGVKSTRPRRTN